MSRSRSESARVRRDVPETVASSGRRRRPRLLAVITEACTGCFACVDFCPVDCIDDSPTCRHVGADVRPVHVHDAECIGCELCVKVCEELTWDAIRMVPWDDIHARHDPARARQSLTP